MRDLPARAVTDERASGELGHRDGGATGGRPLGLGGPRSGGDSKHAGREGRRATAGGLTPRRTLRHDPRPGRQGLLCRAATDRSGSGEQGGGRPGSAGAGRSGAPGLDPTRVRHPRRPRSRPMVERPPSKSAAEHAQDGDGGTDDGGEDHARVCASMAPANRHVRRASSWSGVTWSPGTAARRRASGRRAGVGQGAGPCVLSV